MPEEPNYSSCLFKEPTCSSLSSCFGIGDLSRRWFVGICQPLQRIILSARQVDQCYRRSLSMFPCSLSCFRALSNPQSIVLILFAFRECASEPLRCIHSEPDLIQYCNNLPVMLAHTPSSLKVSYNILGRPVVMLQSMLPCCQQKSPRRWYPKDSVFFSGSLGHSSQLRLLKHFRLEGHAL